MSWMGNDGMTVGVMEDGSMPPESVIIADCADHGGMITGGTGVEAASKRGFGFGLRSAQF